MADTIADAFARAEKWVAAHRPDVFRVQAQDAGWRKQPASEKQLLFLKRIKAQFAPDIAPLIYHGPVLVLAYRLHALPNETNHKP